MRKYIVTAVLGACLGSGATVFAAENPFSDIP